jgi:exodeoxyribonuclease VII large subunit
MYLYPMSEKQIFTLRQVVSSIRKTIEERYQSEYWVKAEMHKLGQTRSGHCYPELVQKEDGKIVAEMRGTIWKHNFDRINARFMQVVKEPLKEDTTLLMRIKVSFHEIYGISLQISDIDPNYSLGELQRERAETLKKLQKEGLIDANQKVDFPLLPKRIAIISAESSKGLSDFMKVIEENEWGYRFFTFMFPAYLQGDQAEHSIISQLERIRKVKSHFDVVVIVRGGGGEVGMSCYNNYNLCKAIASFPMPILTGIGHSTNLTVAEMVSYRNAITPTELGDYLIQAFHNFSIPVKDASKQIRTHALQIMELSKVHLSKSTTSFNAVAINAISSEKLALERAGTKLKSAVRQYTYNNNNVLSRFQQTTVSGGRLLIQNNRNSLGKNEIELKNAVQRQFVNEANRIERLEQSVHLLDPINVLNRGFSITTINGSTISKKNPITTGDIISTKTADFTIESEVIKHKKDEQRD